MTLAEKAAQQIEEWMAQLQHPASTCSNRSKTVMMIQMMMSAVVILANVITTIITDMLGIDPPSCKSLCQVALQCCVARWKKIMHASPLKAVGALDRPNDVISTLADQNNTLRRSSNEALHSIVPHKAAPCMPLMLCLLRIYHLS